MKQFLQEGLKRNAYFLLAAAWLFTIAFIINNYWTNFNSPKYLRSSIERYIQRQEKDFDVLIRDTALLNKLAEKVYTGNELEDMVSKPYGVFIYDPNLFGLISLKFWNIQYALPTPDMLTGARQNGFANLSSGQYEFMHRTVEMGNGKRLVVIGLIPIHKEYFIQINSLKKEFANHSDAEKVIAISHNPTKYPIRSSYGNTLFYVYEKPLSKENNSNWVSLVVGLMGVVFLLIFINNIAVYIAEKTNYLKGITFLLGILIALRSITYIFPHLTRLHQFELFDPSIYSSGYILNSLGDLLINSFLFSWVVLFVKNFSENLSFAALKETRW